MLPIGRALTRARRKPAAAFFPLKCLIISKVIVNHCNILTRGVPEYDDVLRSSQPAEGGQEVGYQGGGLQRAVQRLGEGE